MTPSRCRLSNKPSSALTGFEASAWTRGFHSKDNQVKLKEIVDLVVLPKKGGLTVVDQARDELSERARCNYLYARAVVGREFAFPEVIPASLH